MIANRQKRIVNVLVVICAVLAFGISSFQFQTASSKVTNVETNAIGYYPIVEYETPDLMYGDDVAIDSNHNAWVVDSSARVVAKCTPNGDITAYEMDYQLFSPYVIAYDDSVGKMWIGGQNYVRSIDSNGILGSLVTINIGGAMQMVSDIAVDNDANVWILCQQSLNIIAPTSKETGGFSTVFGQGTLDNERGSIAVGQSDTVWLCGIANNNIMCIDALSGDVVSQFPVTQSNTQQNGIVVDDQNNVFYVDTLNYIGKFTKTGEFTKYVVPTTGSTPYGMAINKNTQDIWFTEGWKSKIAMMTSDGTFTEYNAPSEDSQPIAIALDGNDVWYVNNGNGNIGYMAENKNPITIDNDIVVTIIQAGKWTYGSDDAMGENINKPITIKADIETLDGVNILSTNITYKGVDGVTSVISMTWADGQSNHGNWTGEIPAQSSEGMVTFNITVVSDTNKATTSDYELTVTNVGNILEGISITTWYYIALFTAVIVIAGGILYYYRSKTGGNWRKGKRKR